MQRQDTFILSKNSIDMMLIELKVMHQPNFVTIRTNKTPSLTSSPLILFLITGTIFRLGWGEARNFRECHGLKSNDKWLLLCVGSGCRFSGGSHGSVDEGNRTHDVPLC